MEVDFMHYDRENKSARIRQVQFRMDPEKLRKLKIAIINDDTRHSMADFFNKAADEYLKKQEENDRKW